MIFLGGYLVLFIRIADSIYKAYLVDVDTDFETIGCGAVGQDAGV